MSVKKYLYIFCDFYSQIEDEEFYVFPNNWGKKSYDVGICKDIQEQNWCQKLNISKSLPVELKYFSARDSDSDMAGYWVSSNPVDVDLYKKILRTEKEDFCSSDLDRFVQGLEIVLNSLDDKNYKKIGLVDDVKDIFNI